MLDARLLQLNANLITCLGRRVKSLFPISTFRVGISGERRTVWKYNAIYHLISDLQLKLQDDPLILGK